jgi:hypothetical protein
LFLNNIARRTDARNNRRDYELVLLEGIDELSVELQCSIEDPDGRGIEEPSSSYCTRRSCERTQIMIKEFARLGHWRDKTTIGIVRHSVGTNYACGSW